MPSRANREFGWTTRADSGDLIVRSACRQPRLADTANRLGRARRNETPPDGNVSLGFPDTLARRRRRAFAEEVGTELRPGPPTDDDDDPHEPDEHPRSSAVFRTAQARPRSSSRWAPMSRLG